MANNKKENQQLKEQRLREIKYNNQGYLMKIVEYNKATDIVVEFQDEHKAKVHSKYWNYQNGGIENPFHKSVYGVGVVGNENLGGVNRKEYKAWDRMLERCYSEKLLNRRPTYENVTCCDEWLYYPNFYKWLHSQENYDKWFNSENWAIDKDILIKGNKIYSSDTCCLVPRRVNTLFTKTDAKRGKYPIGVYLKKERKTNIYCAHVSKFNEKTNKKYTEHIGYYATPEEAFQSYKKVKESYIKQVAQEEYDKGNITKQCYEAMMNYEVEITD